MIEAAIIVFLLTGFSLFIQEIFKIPSPMTLVGFVIVTKVLGLDFIHVDEKMFDQIIILMLPILISVDAMQLKISELKAHAFSLFYLAFAAVALSILACVLLNSFILPDYNLSTPALVALFCMVMATDPIAVSAVFGNFKVPHALKIKAEGESLFNDATALIIFGIALNYMSTGGAIDPVALAINGFMVVVGAVIIGAFIGFVGLYLMSVTKTPAVKTSIMMSIAYISYLGAEHFHWSGILSTIISVLITSHVINKRIEKDERIIGWTEHSSPKRLQKLMHRFNDAVVDRVNHQSIVQNIGFLAAFGSTILFISMADLINLDKIKQFWDEILAVFIATTVIRLAVMSKFSLIAGKVRYSHKMSFHWWLVLSSAGVKGGISILMLHMLPKNFEHKDLFEAVVVGVVLLSTFIYPLVLMAVMKIFSRKFERDCLEEERLHGHHAAIHDSGVEPADAEDAIEKASLSAPQA
ncbi:cation:proton antiporter [Pseudomonas syringae pv. actinidiae]|nr:cation:proton antiporter [Pseudomonas syringae pv. actinidiae]